MVGTRCFRPPPEAKGASRPGSPVTAAHVGPQGQCILGMARAHGRMGAWARACKGRVLHTAGARLDSLLLLLHLHLLRGLLLHMCSPVHSAPFLRESPRLPAAARQAGRPGGDTGIRLAGRPSWHWSAALAGRVRPARWPRWASPGPSFPIAAELLWRYGALRALSFYFSIAL
jgi:hypothetical protein